jgi:phenylalanyl-tRNA synthetase beta chain
VTLESAFFDPIGIRRTSRKSGLSTEASYRFERGIDPEIQAIAADRASWLMQELGEGKVAKGIIDKNYSTLSGRIYSFEELSGKSPWHIEFFKQRC